MPTVYSRNLTAALGQSRRLPKIDTISHLCHFFVQQIEIENEPELEITAMLTSFSTRFILLLAACALCSPLALAITPDELKAFRGTYSLDAANYPGCDALIQIATSSTSLQIRSLDEASNTSNGAIFGFESIDLGTVNKDGASVASRYDAQTLTLWTTLKTASNGSTLVTTLTRDSIAKHLRWSRKFSRATHAPWTCTYTRR